MKIMEKHLFLLFIGDNEKNIIKEKKSKHEEGDVDTYYRQECKREILPWIFLSAFLWEHHLIWNPVGSWILKTWKIIEFNNENIGERVGKCCVGGKGRGRKSGWHDVGDRVWESEGGKRGRNAIKGDVMRDKNILISLPCDSVRRIELPQQNEYPNHRLKTNLSTVKISISFPPGFVFIVGHFILFW